MVFEDPEAPMTKLRRTAQNGLGSFALGFRVQGLGVYGLGPKLGAQLQKRVEGFV